MGQEIESGSGEETINWHPGDTGNADAAAWLRQAAEHRKKQAAADAAAAKEQRFGKATLAAAKKEVADAARAGQHDPHETVDPVQLDLSAQRDVLLTEMDDDLPPAQADRSWGERAKGFLGKLIGR